jgi:hypothetical protein
MRVGLFKEVAVGVLPTIGNTTNVERVGEAGHTYDSGQSNGYQCSTNKL